ncbi:MAG: bifunctional oligoribonuclease/PAP phosphatase NrnA [Candidatus Azambacteria bacterium]|nr:bifunctional oligoribonuclease/PAP phosphatase NrnA [Candidatus Azambacteria bacterium]
MTETTIADLIRAKQLIESARTIVLATHENPDADGLGSMLAIAQYLDTLNKSYVVYISGSVPQNLSFLPHFEKITSEISLHEPDLVIGFDYGDVARLRLPYTAPRTYHFITLDHHPKTTQEGEVCIIDTSVSSTCELTYRFFTANDIPITPAIATCIYTGIVTDTGGFVHTNTTADTFTVAGELLRHTPIDTEWISKRVLGFPSYGAARVTGLALSRIAINQEARIAYTYLSSHDMEEHGIAWEDVDNIVNLTNHITNEHVVCVALFKEKNDGMISVSFRSDATKNFDVRQVAIALGGGGHRFAAAAKLQGTREEVMEKVFEEIKKNLMAR